MFSRGREEEGAKVTDPEEGSRERGKDVRKRGFQGKPRKGHEKGQKKRSQRAWLTVPVLSLPTSCLKKEGLVIAITSSVITFRLSSGDIPVCLALPALETNWDRHDTRLTIPSPPTQSAQMLGGRIL